MSKHFLLNSVCVTILGAFAGYSVTHMLLDSQRGLNQNQLRDLASIPSEHTLGKIAAQQIYQDYFDVRIKHEDIAVDENKQSIVKAVIVAKKDLPAGLSFKWVLGEDVQATSSDLQGVLSEIKQGEQKEVYLHVYGFSKQQKSFLSFEIKGTADNHLLIKEVISSSRPEDSFEYMVQQANAAELKAVQNQKGVSKMSSKSALNKKFSLENIVK